MSPDRIAARDSPKAFIAVAVQKCFQRVTSHRSGGHANVIVARRLQTTSWVGTCRRHGRRRGQLHD